MELPKPTEHILENSASIAKSKELTKEAVNNNIILDILGYQNRKEHFCAFQMMVFFMQEK